MPPLPDCLAELSVQEPRQAPVPSPLPSPAREDWYAERRDRDARDARDAREAHLEPAAERREHGDRREARLDPPVLGTLVSEASPARASVRPTRASQASQQATEEQFPDGMGPNEAGLADQGQEPGAFDVAASDDPLPARRIFIPQNSGVRVLDGMPDAPSDALAFALTDARVADALADARAADGADARAADARAAETLAGALADLDLS